MQGAAQLTEMMHHRALAQALACGLAAASCNVAPSPVFKKVKSCGGLWRPSKYVGEYSLSRGGGSPLGVGHVGAAEEGAPTPERMITLQLR